MENIEKLMNEHPLPDLKTQCISKHSDVNMTLEMNRKTILKVGKNRGRTHLVSLEPCTKGKV